jgi:hypothetical protein
VSARRGGGPRGTAAEELREGRGRPRVDLLLVAGMALLTALTLFVTLEVFALAALAAVPR